MTIRAARSRKACACAAALAVGVLCIAPPCAAGEAVPGPTRSTSLSKLSAASAVVLLHADQGATAADNNSSRPFFKTPKGVAVLALVGAGFGYALYSKSHDRVLSAIR